MLALLLLMIPTLKDAIQVSHTRPACNNKKENLTYHRALDVIALVPSMLKHLIVRHMG